MEIIQGIFVDPPIAVARLGGSTAPQDAYRWVESKNPRTDGNTVIDPWWTLDVTGDGSVEPRMPTSLRLRDADLIRPVAPFFEIWALVGKRGSKRASWREVPLTLSLLRDNGADPSAIVLTIEAKNRKAERRRRNKDLVFGTFPPVTISADNHDLHPLLGISPPGANPPMIPPGRAIPLGSVQVMRPRPQPKDPPWDDVVNVETMRFRFTPARGHFYGPREAATATESHGIAVEPANAFLDRDAGWFGQITERTLQPDDTYDTIIPEGLTNFDERSLGVVDDTCEARIAVSLNLAANRSFTAHANVFVGPPDFAPDRRPFLSIADEIDDRSGDGAKRNAALTGAEREAWVQDLFERIYETVSLFNADHFQHERSIALNAGRRRAKPIKGDHLKQPRLHAMTGVDRLRNPDQKIDARGKDEPLPVSEHARTRHRAYQDIEALRELVFQMPDRLETLIRQPFEIEDIEDSINSTMRMPPFMRNSNAFPLTLSSWQYDLLMSWVTAVKKKRPRRVAHKEGPRLSKGAAARRDAVLKRLDGRARR